MSGRALTLYPAIDLRGGYAVRLERGDPSRETCYDADPVARARAFVAAGARALHVVDLDGAFGTGENQGALRAICASVDVPVQTGGGIRSAADVDARFDAGARQVVIGTLLAERPSDARAIVETFGERIVAGIDARGDRVATRGWLADAGASRDDLVRTVAAWGVRRIVYTEIARDGTGAGYDVAALAHVASLAPLRVTASGGARTLDDLRALRDGTPENVDAAIVGRALYEGTLDLEDALAELTR
ncbi:1-(5-phosphoribosyl)-5-[(5-phosphoribosylamino) methylideneamino] imidazole-4-carboxamide isomerase [Vulcanimicrobium alpinum]|uniref:1-(5-phosphoribosyl)-5-[(5-phosphoribosylamino)methylideneamino] imidazole-4-carboxamide isomerase n=1 Tax=Vulcanimicrobium alpinum TaxID=3016050 RepID=A0AAN1XYV9_UNVUL|nr:HisA/HisF-related TIM barrel protein [Vulcanimicrobium alpinum]BDE07910.1 1-(5-phosphoribosyl)-5-[(5-phosphoribosylamino) methylideneamino] imidazole-4-carboxamide isomerase [Vulcanimicrobium alpinum]